MSPILLAVLIVGGVGLVLGLVLAIASVLLSVPTDPRVEKLCDVLKRLQKSGNTIVVIEHNLDVIKLADYVIDLGPEGGDMGGQIVAQGSPEQVAKVPGSYTGQFLKKIL